MYSAYRLNKQGDSWHPCHTPFSILNQSVVPDRVLTVASWSTYKVSKETGKMVWYSHLFESSPQFVMIHTVKYFRVVNETQVDIFLEFPCFLYDPVNVDNLISGSSAFSKPNLDIWKFFLCIMLNSKMQDFKYVLTSVGDEHSCLMLRTFFITTLLENLDEDWLLQSCDQCWVFQICNTLSAMLWNH